MSRSSSDVATATEPTDAPPAVDGDGRGADAIGHRRGAAAVLRRIITNEYVLASLVFAALIAVFFNPIVRNDATFSSVRNTMTFVDPWNPLLPDDYPELHIQQDQAEAFHPAQVYLDQTLENDGQIPLWNSLQFGGHPYFANSGTGLAYPPRVVLAMVFEPARAHDAYVVLHLFAAGLAMFAFMKTLGTRFAGALFAAIAWSWCSYVLAWIQLEQVGAVAALLPLVALCIRRWYDRRSFNELLLGGLVLGGLFLGTSAYLSLMSFLFAFGYAAALALRRLYDERRQLDTRRRLAVVAAPAVVIVLGLLVAAVGALPFLELSSRWSREPLTWNELHTAPGLLVTTPSQFEYVLRAPPTPISQDDIFAGQTFVGTLTAVFAAGALFLRRRPGTGLGRTLVIVMALYALGTPLAWLGYYLVPGLKSLVGLGRSLFLFDFGVALLGGIGLDAALGWLRERRLRVWRRRGGLAWPGWLGRAQVRTAVAAGLAVVVIGATSVQLLTYGRRANPPFQRNDAADLFPDTPAITAVRDAVGDEPGAGRVLPINDEFSRNSVHPRISTLAGAIPMALNLRNAGGYEAILPHDVFTLWQAIGGKTIDEARDPINAAAFLRFHPDTRAELLGRVGVSAVIGPFNMAGEDGWSPEEAAERGLTISYFGADGTVYEVDDPSPRAYVVPDARQVDSQDDALEAFLEPDFDASSTVILEGDAGSNEPVGTAAVDAEVTWLADKPNDLRLEVTSSAEAWLVVLDTWSTGWYATVDGEDVDIERANSVFRAIRVPAGTSEVEFRYRPVSVVVGAVVSTVTTLTILGVLGFAWYRRRRTRPSGVVAKRPPSEY